MRRSARIWAAAVGTAFVVLVTAVVLTTGGWERAVYTISGDELKEEEAQLRSETATASPEATGSIEATGGEF